MIVNDETVSKALAYLAEDPHPIALAKKDATDARNAREATFASMFTALTGTVRERECAIEQTPVFKEHKASEAAAEMALERHKARTRAAEMIIEVWRSENANARAAERVR